MADTRTTQQQTDTRRDSGQSLARQDRQRGRLQPWSGPYASSSPFELMDRITEDFDRAFESMFRGFGLPRRSLAPRGSFGSLSRESVWSPRVEAFQKGDRFIVRAELPGLKKDDVQVELTDDALAVRGERREEHEEEREGYYHSEREYGQFYRTIPLPDGVIAESAQATFRDGVLEVTMQAAPSEANRGRRLEIKEASDQQKK